MPEGKVSVEAVSLFKGENRRPKNVNLATKHHFAQAERHEDNSKYPRRKKKNAR
jgi:hypothetical protein